MKLKLQLIIVLLAISIAPVLVLGIVTYKNTINEINIEKTSTLKAYSEGISRNIENQMESAGNLLKGLSSHMDLILILENFNHNPGLVDKLRYNAIQVSFKNVVSSSKRLYEAVFVTDSEGKVVMEGSKNSNTYLNKKFFNNNDFEHIKMKDEIFIGDPFVSKISGNLLLPVSKPIKSGTFLGAMTVLFDLNKFTAGFDSVKPGRTGEVVVINAKGTIIYHPDKKLINTKNTNTVLDKILKSNEKLKGFLIYNNSGKQKALFFHKPPLTGWLICAQIDNNEFNRAAAEFGTFIIIAIFVLAVISVLISLLYSGYISRPLISLMNLMKQVENGKLNVSAHFCSTVYEIQELKKGFFDMVRNLRLLIDNIKIASVQVSTSASGMSSASQNSIANAEQTTSAVAGITSGIQMQAKNTEIAARSIEGLVGRINTAKELSNEISTFSSKINASAEDGFKLVELLKKKSEENVKNTEMVNSMIKLLNKELAEINKIAVTIASIARHTNMLSLNASIEAARAGELGKGFAVVAREIQGLSDQTRLEAAEINKLISNIESKASELVLTMESAALAADEQNLAVIDTGKTFTDIFESIKDIRGKIINIALYLEQMNEEKNNIIMLVRDISSLSEEVASSSENVQQFVGSQMDLIKEVNNYLNVLNNLAGALDKSVEMFKL